MCINALRLGHSYEVLEPRVRSQSCDIDVIPPAVCGTSQKASGAQWMDTDSSEETAGQDQEGDALSVGAAWMDGDPLCIGPQIG